MMVGTLSLVQKGQTRGCSGRSTQWNSGMWWWGHCLQCKKVKPVEAVDAVCNGIVVYGGGDIVLWYKKVKPVDAVYHGHSGIVIYGGGDIYHHIPLFHSIHCVLGTASTGLTFLYQRQCPHHHIPLFHCVLHPLHTASTVYCVHCVTASTESTGLTFLHQRQCPCHHVQLFHCIHWFDLFVSKTPSQPPYTTIPLHPLCTASITSTGLTFLHQRTMSPPSYTTIPLHTVSQQPHITIALHTASTASSGLTFLHQRQCPTTIYHYSTASTAYCIHWFDLFCIKDNVPATIYHYSTASTGLTFLHQRQYPSHHHIPLFHCILHPNNHISLLHCVLHPLYPLV